MCSNPDASLVDRASFLKQIGSAGKDLPSGSHGRYHQLNGRLRDHPRQDHFTKWRTVERDRAAIPTYGRVERGGGWRYRPTSIHPWLVGD